MAESWLLCQNICFGGGKSKFGANVAIKLCFDSFFRFLGGKLGSKIGDEGLNQILKHKYFGVAQKLLFLFDTELTMKID